MERSSNEQEARDFLKECFGDEEIFTINSKDKERILGLCHEIAEEWNDKDKWLKEDN